MPWLIRACDSEVNSTTPSGYLRAPGDNLILSWFESANKKINKELIEKTFKRLVLNIEDNEKELLDQLKISFEQQIVSYVIRYHFSYTL